MSRPKRYLSREEVERQLHAHQDIAEDRSDDSDFELSDISDEPDEYVPVALESSLDSSDEEEIATNFHDLGVYRY